jgi:hypothetical protein
MHYHETTKKVNETVTKERKLLNVLILTVVAIYIVHLLSLSFSHVEAIPIPGKRPPGFSACIECIFIESNETNLTNINSIFNETSGEMGRLNFTQPSNGLLIGIPPNLKYIPDAGFVGNDSFIILQQNNSNPDNISTTEVRISVIPSALNFFASVDPIERIIIALITAFVIVVSLLLITREIIVKSRSTTGVYYRPKFLNIIHAPNMELSLSIFQFFIWTLVIIYAILVIYLVRLFSGVSDLHSFGIPINVIILMGISIGVPIITGLTSSRHRQTYTQYADETIDSMQNDVPRQAAGTADRRSGFAEMLKENGKPSLSRFQMFILTWISITVYLFVFFSKVFEAPENPQNLSIPDIDPIFVVLMGLSLSAYLGLSQLSSKGTQITKIYPLKGEPGNTVSIFGKNLGIEKKAVWLGKMRLNDENVNLWTNERIDIIVPGDIPAGTHTVMIAEGGTLIKAEDKFTIIKTLSENTTSDIQLTVVNTSPKDGDSEVELTPTVTVTFNKPVNVFTINPVIFNVKESSNSSVVPGTLSLTTNNKTAIFNPSSYLTPSTTYISTVSKEIKDLADNMMLSDRSWSFTTTKTPPPTLQRLQQKQSMD